MSDLTEHEDKLEKLKQAEQEALQKLENARQLEESAREVRNLAFTEWLTVNKEYTIALVMGAIKGAGKR
jgi:hypothetical protein